MALHPININNLQLVEFAQFITRFISDFTGASLDSNYDSIFKKNYDQLLVQSQVFDKAVLQVRAKVESDVIIDLDNKRDKKIISLRNSIKAHCYSEIATVINAYQILNNVMKTYKGIERLNYEAETKAIDNLVAELNKTTVLQAIETLNLRDFVNNLTVANTNFKAVYNKRSSGNLTTEVFDAKKLRGEISETYRDISQYINLMAKNTDVSFYHDTLAVLNNGRSNFATILAVRTGHQNKDKKE